ncbi:MAG TPA: kelch repeat-containing protein, partial [Candidatus Thermoplasmatota archaeon]
MKLARTVWALAVVLVAGCLGPTPADGTEPTADPVATVVEWRAVSPGLTPRNEVALGILGSTFYAIGGNNPDWGAGSVYAEIYDAKLDNWTKAPDFVYPIHHTAVVGVNDAIYVVGGFTTDSTAQSTVFKLNAGAHQWESVASMPLPRAAHAAAVVGDLIVVVGGYVGPGLHVPPIAIYDSKADSWELGPVLPTPRDHLAAAAVGTKVYAIAGDVAGHGTNTAAVEAYDTATGLMSTVASLPRVRGSLSAVEFNGSIIVAGGQDGSRTYAEVDVYDPSKNAWSTWPDMTQARHGFGLGSYADFVYAVMGGPEPGRTSTEMVEAFGPHPSNETADAA